MKINEKNLCVFATTPPYDLDGFLNKRGEGNKNFLRRYFVLKGNLLFYFEKKTDKEPLGLIIVEGCTIELSEESDQYCFEIAFPGNRKYILSADSQESMEQWMKALTCAGYEFKLLMIAELQRQLEEIDESRNRVSKDTNAAIPIPKPPPRRQNPFNRPAPPPPNISAPQNGPNSIAMANDNSLNLSAMINNDIGQLNGAHFGSTSHRSNSNFYTNTETVGGTSSNSNSNDTSPVPPPRSAKSEFYIQTQIQNKQPQPQPQHQSHSQSKSAKQLSGTTTAPALALATFSSSTSNTVFPISTSTTADLNAINAVDAFEELHEKFRRVVMKDVLDYRNQRELKTKPLIEL